MPGQQGGWNLPQANSNFSGGRAANPLLALFAGRRANVEKLNNLEMQSKAQVWTADQKAGNEVKHAKKHADFMANYQVGDKMDDEGNVTEKAKDAQGNPIANVNHGMPISKVLSGVRVGQTSTTFQKLGNTAHESSADKKPKKGPRNRGGGQSRGKDASIAAMVAGIKAGHFTTEEATGPGEGENWAVESSFAKRKSSTKGAGQATDAPGPMSKKFAQDYGAHIAGGGTEESYLNQFGPSGRRKKTTPPGNNGGNS